MPSTNSAQGDHQQLFREVPLLARLVDADLSALASRGKEREFGASSVIFREGEAGDSLHVVMDGRVRISVVSPEGSEATLSFIEKGDCFGDLAIFDGGPRTATATAVGATKTFVIMREDFLAWVEERPKAAIALLETLSRRIRRTDEVLADLSFLDLPHRLAKQLLHMHRDAPAKDGGRIRITQAELASMLSVSRESVNKQLNEFQRDGWIAISRGAVVVKDPGALRTFA
jgi:CRP/FNR family transcriptional regulator, cyclic AMP receptor protein